MTSQAQTMRKDPDATLDYGFDWSDWLATSESILNSDWTVPTGITRVSDSANATTTKIWLSGGTVGNSYLVTNEVETSAGRIEDRSFLIQVEER